MTMMITEIVTVIIESSSTDHQQMWYRSDAAGTDTGCAYAADADNDDDGSGHGDG